MFGISLKSWSILENTEVEMKKKERKKERKTEK